jgi:outer membrane protein OmpA-like peptidoglycan-associated protein
MAATATKIRPFLILLTLLTALVLASPAKAQVALDDFIELGVRDKVTEASGDKPALMVRAKKKLKRLSVTVRSGKKVHEFEAKGLKRGAKRTFSWKQKKGARTWRVEVVLAQKDEREASFAFEIKTEVVGTPTLKVGRNDVDLEGRCVTVHLSRPIALVQMRVLADGGKEVASVEEKQGGDGRNEKVCWNQKEAVDVELLDLRVYDPDGQWAGIQVSAFQVRVPPSSQVEFETGKWDIRPGEEHKLKDLLVRLKEKVARHGKVVPLQLYVIGHTDTVGGDADNLALSRNRARSIASWFKRHKLKIPIHFQGLGERRPVIKTPDNTDEARNRRAVYVLSAGPPSGTGVSEGSWKRVQ